MAKPFSIQVGAFTNEENAIKLKAELGRSGFPAFIIPSANIIKYKIFRLNVGPFATKQEAETKLDHLKQSGYSQAFVKRHSDMIVKVDSLATKIDSLRTDLKQITASGGCRKPAWSPDGREIAFLLDKNGKKGIYSVGTGGGSFSKIVEEDNQFKITGEFTWSNNGNSIAFIAKEINELYENVENLYITNKNEIDPIKLTNQKGISFDINNLKWSPQNAYIAFNAAYNKADKNTVPIQRIIIIPAKLPNPDTSEASAVFNIQDDSDWLNLIGWQSDEKLIYLSKSEPHQFVDTYQYLVKRFDLKSGQSSTVYPLSSIGDVKVLGLIADKNVLVYQSGNEHYTQITSLNLSEGNEYVLFESDAENESTLIGAVSGNGEIIFSTKEEIWINDTATRKAVFRIDFHFNDFILSPSGKKLCFEEKGDLFTIKLP